MSDARELRSVRVVAGVVRDAGGRVLLAQRPQGKHLAGGWEFPGGKLESGEAPLAGLQRELREEIGIEVQAATPLMRVHHRYADRDIDLDVWTVNAYRGEPQGREGQAVQWFSREELGRADVLAADAPVIAALLAGDPR